MQLLELVKVISNDDSIDLKDRSKVLELAVAEAIATVTPLPITKLETSKTSSFFTTNHKVNVIQALSMVNEFIVLDIDQTCDLVYHIWLIRYLFVHVPNDPRIMTLGTALVMQNDSHIPNVYGDVRSKYPEAYFNKWKLATLTEE